MLYIPISLSPFIIREETLNTTKHKEVQINIRFFKAVLLDHPVLLWADKKLLYGFFVYIIYKVDISVIT